MKNVLGDAVAEGVYLLIGHAAGDEVEGEVKVGQGEVGEKELQQLVDKLDVKQNFAPEGVVGAPDLPEVYERVDGSKEGAVEPAPPLRDELGDGVCGELWCQRLSCETIM